MLKVVGFYIFMWWFTKLENKTALIARSVLASILAAIFIISGISFLFDENVIEKNKTIIVIMSLIFTILFSIRLIFDIIKINKINTKS